VRTIRAFVEITRLDTAFLGFLSVFVPYFSRTRDGKLAVTQALPILFACMSTFVANDLDDVERDAINHPKRPLPSRSLQPATATAIYFGCIAAALYATKHAINESLAFWYYGLIVLSVSYGYVVEFVPTLKTLYVGLCAAAPIAIVSAAFESEWSLKLVAAAVFVASVGRETCMDVRDRSGDRPSWISRQNPARVAVAGVGLQALGLVLLVPCVDRGLEALALALMVGVLVAARWYWFREHRLRLSIGLMKVQFALGLVFLL